MKHLILSLLTLVLAIPFAQAAQSQTKFDHEHTALTQVLAKHMVGDRVDYRGLAKDKGTLEGYLSGLEAVTAADFRLFSRQQKFAFWINAYNGYTLQLIIDKYPLDSIKDIGGLFSAGPWEKRFIELQHLAPQLGKKKLNLETIEHKILRPEFKDARVHAAINCASVGCPPLRQEAFVAPRLEAQLAEQTKIWLGDPKRNSFDPKAKRAKVSKIFDWFDEDFGKKDAKVLAWIAEHGPEETVGWLKTASGVKLRYTSYDWDLNEVKR